MARNEQGVIPGVDMEEFRKKRLRTLSAEQLDVVEKFMWEMFGWGEKGYRSCGKDTLEQMRTELGGV